MTVMTHEVEGQETLGRGGAVGALLARVRGFAMREAPVRPVWSQERSESFLRDLETLREAGGGVATGLDGVVSEAA